MTDDTDFSALAHEAAQADADTVGPQAAPEAAPVAAEPVPTDLDEARMIIGLVCVHTNAIFPFLAPIYTDDVQDKLAGVTAPLMKKYGLTAGGLFERYKEEIAFALVAVPLSLATAQAFRSQRAAAPVPVEDTAPAPVAA